MVQRSILIEPLCRKHKKIFALLQFFLQEGHKMDFFFDIHEVLVYLTLISCLYSKFKILKRHSNYRIAQKSKYLYFLIDLYLFMFGFHPARKKYKRLLQTYYLTIFKIT